jgi:hypothetical protein
MEEEEVMSPRVFISYAWEDEGYRQWVEKLAGRLHTEARLEVRLDAWHSTRGSILDFISTEFRKADAVLILCSPLYRQKVHAKEENREASFSGWEAGLVSADLFANSKRIVVALARGKWENAAPDFLRSHVRHDLSQPESFEKEFGVLVRELQGINREPPAVGGPALEKPPAAQPAADDKQANLNLFDHKMGTRRLFGVEPLKEHVRNRLTDPDGPAVVAIEGLGGIGKTALAAAAARAMLEATGDLDVAWYSFRQEDFDFWKKNPARSPQILALDSVISSVTQQLGDRETLRSASIDRAPGFLRSLAARSALVVIDNVEAPEELELVRPLLERADFARPSRFILTSRASALFPVHSVRLRELIAADAIALLRYEADRRNIESVRNAQDDQLERVFATIGGNPLALNLALGLMAHFPLESALARLIEDRRSEAEGLYSWIYRASWNTLSADGRQVLMILSRLSADGVSGPRLEAVAGLPPDRLEEALRELSLLSLVESSASLEERIFSLHRLTWQFCLNTALTSAPPAEKERLEAALRNFRRANLKYSQNRR